MNCPVCGSPMILSDEFVRDDTGKLIVLWSYICLGCSYEEPLNKDDN